MGKAETLQRIKETEAQIRAARAVAEQERERMLREARREALELLETARDRAEARYREIVTAADTEVSAERERMLGAAREEAQSVASRARANVDRAVDLVLEKFRGSLRA